MIDIDGSAGGGQIVRTTLSLSVLTGEPVRIEDVRGDRDDPGLKHQHLAAVDLAAEICDADVEGARLGTETVRFEPGPVEGGRYAVDVGTAGSATLVFDTVLPLATRIDDPLSVTVTGGTDVTWSPTADYYRQVKLPLLRRHGVQAAVDVERRGFYPEGGGVASLHVGPSTPAAVRLTDRGERREVRIYSVATDDLAGADVAQRQAQGAQNALPRDIGVAERTARYVDATSTGSALTVRADYEEGVAGFASLGEPGTPAEKVGETAALAFERFENGHGAVDRHLSDQLLVWLALAGGELAVPEVTAHVESSAELLGEFGVDVRVDGHRDAPRVVVESTLDR